LPAWFVRRVARHLAERGQLNPLVFERALKTTMGYRDGFIGEGQISDAGPEARAPGERALAVLRERLVRLGWSHQNAGTSRTRGAGGRGLVHQRASRRRKIEPQ